MVPVLVTSPIERNEDLLRRYIEEVWDEGDIEVIDEIFGDLQNMRRKWGKDIDDREELKSYIGGLVDKYDEQTLEVRSVLADEDEAMLFWEAEMQLVDDHLGIKSAGRASSRRGVTYGRIEDGRLARVIDISDSRELMPKVRRLARAELMANMSDGVIIVDDEEYVVDINEVALEAFDFEREDALDRPVEEVFGTEIEIPGEGETTELSAPGNRRVFEMSVATVTDPKDERVGRALVLREVTARKRYEEQLQVLNRVLRHNLRNDMTGIKGRATHLRELAVTGDVDADEVRSLADGILDLADDLVALGDTARDLDAILDTAVSTEQIDLAAATHETVASVASRFPATAIETTLPEEAPVVAVEALPLAIEAVLENACEHNDADQPRVAVSAETAEVDGESYRRLCVADNGPGIPAYERRVVEIGEETDLEHGSGLGLWLVRWVTRRSGGAFSFEERQNGTAVLLDFPMADA